MKRKEAVYKGIEFIPVYFEDNSLTSPDYFQITEFPTRLTAGKNLFKLRGHPTNLKVGGILNMEVLDYNGDPIYSEVIDYIDEDKSRVIAIYIYTETSPGDCTITLIAEASTINGAPVPIDWQGRPNIKWTRTVPVNPNVSNVSEIIFDTTPIVTVDEIVGVHLDRTYAIGQFPTYSTGSVRYFTYNNQPAIEITGGFFTADMATGTLTVTSPQNPSPTPSYPISTTVFTSTVKKILSPTTALLDREYTAYSSQSMSAHTFMAFDNSTFTMNYEATPSYSETENSQSFAYIQIKELEPAAGDVSRIKVFTNNNGTIGSWDLVNDVELTETEIFVASTSSLYPDTSIGIFTTQSIINTYWEAAAYQSSTILTTPTLTWTSASISNAMKITTTSLTEKNQVAIAKIKSQYAGVFIEKSAYKVTLDAYCESAGTLSVYLSGSAFFQDSTDYFNQEFPKTFGKRIGEITAITNQRIDDHVFNFESDYTGTGVIILVIESGAWQIADVKTTSDNDAGYSPNYTRIKTPISTTHKIGNQLSFKVEYYNVNGEKSKQISYINNKDWQGGNRYIDGNYSMLTGSLYVADSLESGIGISGYKNAGFIRSLGYEGLDAGFPGFLIWSGSALPGQTSKGLAYSGVGIELYANTSSYFRYSTTDSEIDVRTDKFFFGQYPAPFISGANGNIEISASNFHLSPEGNVTASNALFTGVALANIIRDKTVVITAANSSSYFQTYDIQPGAGTTLGTRIVMDGTLGGEIIRRVRLNVAPPYPIADFKLPSLSSTAKLDITIETNISSVEFYDVFIPGKSSPALYPPNTVSLDSNAVVTFVAGGSTGASWLTIAGTEHPFDHVFKNDVFITGSGILRLEKTNTSDPSALFSTTGSSWIIGIDQSDANSFKINNAAGLTTGPSMALRIDTDENISIPGNVEITGSFALGGIANTVTTNALYYNTTTKQVTYGASGSGGSGSTSPGGSDTQIQYNNAGAFGGVSALTWDGTTLRATGSFTGSLTGIATSGSSILVTNTPATSGTYYPVFVNGITGYRSALVDNSTFTYDTTTNTLTVTASYANVALTASIATTASYAINATTASYFSGSISNAVNTNNINITDNPTYGGVTYYPTFVGNTTGYTNVLVDSSVFTYNPNTNVLNTTASYALSAANGGVTQLIAGSGISLSPTTGTGSVTITSLGSVYNTATGSYGSFYDTGSVLATSATTVYSMSLNTTDISNGVFISASNGDNTRIKFTNSGTYNIQFSSQFSNTDNSTQDTVVWIRKNGTDIPDSSGTVGVPPFKAGSNGQVIASWNYYLNISSGDFIQMCWHVEQANVITLETIAAGTSPTHPRTPSTILTATRVDTFLSNTGSFSGSFTGTLTGSFSGSGTITSASYAATASLAPLYLPLAGGTISGNVTILGTASINTLIVNQIGYSSGSNQLGDAANDVQTLYGTVVIPTGSLTVTGSLAVSSSATIQTLTVGLGGGQVASNTAVGYRALEANSVGSGNVAIGPTALLRNTSGSNNIAIGNLTLSQNLTGANNIAIGPQALQNTTTTHNLGIGNNALTTNTSGVQNVAVGNYALNSNTTNGYSVAVGYASLYSNTAANNVAIGTQAGYTNTSGEVVAVGYKALFLNSVGLGNTAIGYQSIINNTSGSYNTAVGSLTMQSNTTGNQNSGFGQATLSSNTTGNDNTAIGMQSLYSNTTGGQNAGLGFYALRSNVTGSSNVAVGYMALRSNDASQNTAIGFQAGYSGVANTSGTNNIFIGYNATGVSATESNRTWIGNSSTTSTWLAGNALIGTTTDAGYKLDVNGTARVKGTGTTSATSAFTVQNSAGTENFRVQDDGVLFVRGAAAIRTGTAGSTYYLDLGNIVVRNGNALADSTISIGKLTTADASSICDLVSTTKGFLPPRMTLAQRVAISTPASGLIVFETGSAATEGLWVNETTGWQQLLSNTGSQSISGSLNVTGGITGSLLGTASFASTASYVNTLNQDVNINGTLTATIKSFLIEHPTQPGKQLQYGNLEGPEHAVYFRGKNTTNTIQLPEEWTGLVDELTITVQLTSIGKHQQLYVEDIANNIVTIGSDTESTFNYFFIIHAERKDVEKLQKVI